jgi:DnaJ domain
MFVFSKITTRVGDYLNGLKSEIKQLRRELARRRKERHWKRTKRRVSWAKSVCEQWLAGQLYDEHLQRTMTTRICDVRFAGIGPTRIEALHRAGVQMAYDVYHKGIEGLCEITSIGPKIAGTLLEWAHTHLPHSFAVDKGSSEYIRRIRILKRQHLNMHTAATHTPPPEANQSQQLNYHRGILEVPASASRDEIREAYRQRMREYHPDKVAHVGSDLRNLPESKAKRINEEALYH